MNGSFSYSLSFFLVATIVLLRLGVTPLSMPSLNIVHLVRIALVRSILLSHIIDFIVAYNRFYL
jgi:hypothetical protein